MRLERNLIIFVIMNHKGYPIGAFRSADRAVKFAQEHGFVIVPVELKE